MIRTSVVTGAASGIGLATAERLRADGHRVVGVDLGGADVCVDLATNEGRHRMVEAVEELTDGAVDVVVACAGTVNRGRTDVSVNYFGAVATLDGLRPLLARGDRPRAVATASFAVVDDVDRAIVDACLAGDEEEALAAVDALAAAHAMRTYSSSKRALARWIRTQATAADWAGAGIALNAVAPGVVRTPMTSPLLDDPNLADLLLGAVPMPFEGVLEPAAVAHILALLTSPDWQGMTGQTIFVDGGAECVRRGNDIWA